MTSEVSLETLLARLDALEKDNAELREEQNKIANGDYQDSLVNAVQEFRKANETEITTSIMFGPCYVCNKTWRDENGDIRKEHRVNTLNGHFFSRKPLPKSDRNPAERAMWRRDNLSPRVDAEDPSEFYLSEADAAKLLKTSVTKLRRMANLKRDKIAGVTLIHTSSVNQILELADANKVAVENG